MGAVDVTSLNGLGLNPPFRFQDGSYPGTDGDCGLVLAPSATCTVVVTFEPPGIGSFADIMEVNFQNGAGPQTRTLNVEGEGVSAAVLTIAEVEPYVYPPQTIDSVSYTHLTLPTNREV